MSNHHGGVSLKRGGPAAPPDSVDFLPRVPKGPVVPSRRGHEDADEKRERMEDPVAAGEFSLLKCVLLVTREGRRVGSGGLGPQPSHSPPKYLDAQGWTQCAVSRAKQLCCC